MAEFNPYTLEEEKWTPKNVYEILPPNAVSWSDYDFGAGTDNVDKEAANKSLIDGFVDFFKELFGTAGAILGGAIELGGAILGGFVNGVINFIGGIANALGSIFGGGPTESPYPPMFSPIKANLEAAIQPFKDQIEESKQKSEDLLAEQLDIRGQIAEQIEIAKAAIEDAKAASERAGVAIEGAQAASDAAQAAREQLEEYNTALNKRITTEFNSAVGRADTAVEKADSLAQQLEDFKQKTAEDVESALSKAEQANQDLAALSPQIESALAESSAANQKVADLTPQVSDAVSKAGAASAKADQTLSDYTAWATAQKTRIDSAVSKAEAATANVNTLTPKVTDAVAKATTATNDVATLTPKVTKATSDAKAANDKVAELTPQVASAVSEAAAATANVSTLTPKVDDAATKATKASTDVSTLTPKVTKATTDAANAVASVGTLTPKVDDAAAKATKASTDVSALSPRVDDAVAKANKATSDLSTLTPKVTAAQTRADNAFIEAGKVRTEVTPKIEAAQTKGESALAVADKAVDWLRNPNEIGASLIAIDPETKKPNWAENLERVPAEENPSNLPDAYRNTLNPTSHRVRAMWINVDPTTEYLVSLWVKADKPGSNMTYDMRDQDSNLAFKASRSVEGFLNAGDSYRPFWIKGVPTEWTQYKAIVTPNDNARKVYFVLPYFNHSGGSTRDAVQYIADFQIYPLVPSQADVDQAQNDAIKANQDILRQQGEINAAQATANLAQKNFNDNQTKWNKASTDATKSLQDFATLQGVVNAEQTKFNTFQTDFNTKQTKWNKASEDATKALADAQQVQSNLNIEQGKLNTLQSNFNTKQTEWNAGTTAALEAQKKVNDNFTKWNTAATQAKAAQDKLNEKQDEWNAGVTAALETQKKVNDNFSKWTDGAATAIEANTKAIALLSAPQGASSIIPINPLTKEPYYLDWAGDRISVANIDSVPTRTATKYTGTASKRVYPPSNQLVPVKVARGQVYRWVAWTYSNVANSAILIYLRDPATGTGSKATTHDEESKTSGHTPHGLLIRGIPSGWNKVSGTITFQDEISTLETYSVTWNQSNISSSVTQYITGFDIAPDVPTQAQVDAAQNKAIETFDLFMGKQDEWNKGTTAALDAQKKVDDNFKKWSDAAANAIQANTDVATALARINGIQVGGRNLLRNSDVDVANKDYLIARLLLGDSKPAEGEEVTLSLKGELGAGVQYFAAYNSNGNGSSRMANLDLRPEDRGSDGVYRRTGTWKSTAGNVALNLYTFPSSVTTITTVDWVKLERGNKSTDWTPAPEDLPTQKQVDDTQNTAIRANTDALKALGQKILGPSLVPYRVPTDAEMENLSGLGYDPFAEPEYLDAGHYVWSTSRGRVPAASSSQATKSFSGTLVPVDPKLSYQVKFSTWADEAGSKMYVYMLDQNGNTAVAATPFCDATTASSHLIADMTLPKSWKDWSGVISFKPGVTHVKLGTFYWNHSRGTITTRQALTGLEIIPNIPTQAAVDELQDNAIRKNTEIGSENKKAIDALTEGMGAYAAAADLEALHKNLQDELEKEQDARASLAAEINDLLVETIPRTIIYNSGAQFNDHVSAERSKVVAKGTWVGQMLLDVTYVSKSDGSQTRRVIQNLTVPAPDGSREYSVPSASFGGYSPAYRLDYWIYRGRSIQKALSNSGSYITGSSFTRNSWTRIATHTIKKSNGAVYILWRTRLTRADRGVTYSFDVRVNGTSVLDKHYKGYGPLTSFGDGGATLSFSGNLSVPDNGTIEIYAKASGTTTQASVSSNKGTLTYLELE